MSPKALTSFQTFQHLTIELLTYSIINFNLLILSLNTSTTYSLILYENQDIALAMSSSSHADPGLEVAFKYLN